MKKNAARVQRRKEKKRRRSRRGVLWRQDLIELGLNHIAAAAAANKDNYDEEDDEHLYY